MAHTREVRLGLVLYGGVSLAVYENGVAQELYRAIRGEGIYGLVKDLIDSDIIVYIISGTSAGGVNGVMLAYALSTNRDFAPVADLWRNQADIEALLREKDDPKATSILNSDYYQQKLRECFESLRAKPAAPAPCPSAVEELDLFVTGTDANGRISTIYDDLGHALDVKNHRALFKLSYRGGRTGDNEKNDFKQADPADLARLCRITSCFPAAFEPVRVEVSDSAFFRWGKLAGPAVYMDGGILNNKPFTSTIDAISRRTAVREVERFLIYVEPDPEVFDSGTPQAVPDSPNVAKAALSALVSIPRYQSIAGDLAAIEAHNERVERLAGILNSIGTPSPMSPADFSADTARVADEIAAQDTYYACRLIQLRDAAVAGILNDPAGRSYISDAQTRRSGKILVESFHYWAGDAAATLMDFDVYFRLRRAGHLSHVLMRRVKQSRDPKEVQAAWDQVNHFFKLYEILEWCMKASVDSTDFEWRKLADLYRNLDLAPEAERKVILSGISAGKWGEVAARLQTVLDTEGIAVPVEPGAAGRGRFYRDLRNRMGQTPQDPARGNLLREVDRQFAEALRKLPDDYIGGSLRAEFSWFLEFDRLVFPMLFGLDGHSVDPIRVVRFSPRDAQRGLSKGEPAAKVCGSTLGAFGGFFKKTWRANDIMIGRLDSVCQLLECLLTRVALARAAHPPNLTAADMIRYGIESSAAAGLAPEINAYLAKTTAATDEDWSRLIDVLVGASHQEILEQEWPNVTRSALDQEYAWGQYDSRDTPPDHPYDARNRKWVRGKQRPDRILVGLAAKAVAAGATPGFTPGELAGHSFAEEIPEPVLTELTLRGSLRAARSIVASAPSERARLMLEENPLYAWVAGRIIPALYDWTRMRRTKPDLVIVLNTIVPSAALTVFALGVLFMVFPGLGVHWHVWSWMIGFPALLFVLWLLFRRLF